MLIILPRARAKGGAGSAVICPLRPLLTAWHGIRALGAGPISQFNYC